MLKKLFLLCLYLFFAAGSAFAVEFAVKVRIQNKGKLSELSNRVTRFEDVKQSSTGKFIYNEENSYVTVICSKSQLGYLRNSGFDIMSSAEYIEPHSDNPHLELPYQFGWPRTSSNDAPFYNSSSTVADMNGDGQLEIGITHSFSLINPLLYVFKYNGAYVLGFPFVIPFGTLQSSLSWEINAMGDIDGDSQLEIVHADENGNIFAHKYDGSMVPGFPYITGANNEHSVPALQDVNNDGKAEIIITSRDRDNDMNAQIHVLRYTGSNLVELQGFPVNYTKGSESSPVVADVDNDGFYEIFAGTGYDAASGYTGRILCYTANGNPKSGWPVMVGNYAVGNTGTLADINNDNKLDLLIRVQINNVNGIYAFNYAGAVISPFPFVVPSGHPNANVSVGDIDGDGQPEVGFGSAEAINLGKVFVWKLNGTMLPGFPQLVNATWVDGSTAMADVSGDGVDDIIAPNNLGKIYAFNMSGAVVSGFPVSSQASTLNAFETSPTMVDIDHDGDVELFAPCNDRKIYCWDSPGIYDSTKVWSTSKGNPARTGTRRADFEVGVKPNVNILPSQNFLYQNYPNPFNPVTTIAYELPAADYVKLTVYNISGAEITTLVNGRQSAGHYTYNFDGSNYPSGVYFYNLNTGNYSDTKKMILVK